MLIIFTHFIMPELGSYSYTNTLTRTTYPQKKKKKNRSQNLPTIKKRLPKT